MKHTSHVTNLIDTLRAKAYSVGFVESCTGGKISALVSEIPGVSDTFKGSIVSYSEDVKKNLVGVSERLIKEQGIVSEAVALQMALGGREALSVDCVVAVTGYAGPIGGTDLAPVGTVCFGLVGPGFEKAVRKNFSGVRTEIQNQAAQFAIELLVTELRNK